MPIGVDGQTLFVLHSGVGSFSVEERAAAVNQRLQQIVASRAVTLQPEVRKSDLGLLIVVDGISIISVTPGDAEAENVTAEALADRWSAVIHQGLIHTRAAREQLTFRRRLAITAAIIVAAIILLVILHRGHRRALLAVDRRKERIVPFRLGGLELVPQDRVFQWMIRAIRSVHVGLNLAVVAAALLLLFAQFPDTRRYAEKVVLWVLTPLRDLADGFVRYLPNLFYILVIIVVTRLAVRAVGFVFGHAEQGTITLEPWIHRDVARPSSQILKAILVVVALFFVAPLIPGTGSTAAKGLSVIIGLMVSFGSTSTVGNLIAGMVLTYMRPFQDGDRVKIGETMGDIVERRFLHTTVLTTKHEKVIVPSLMALSSAITNYSACAHDQGLILHTAVTIGYDAPWRKVHELLIRAAEQTAHVLKDPRPFVRQDSLDDFFVSYQLNVYTREANRMQQIYCRTPPEYSGLV